MLQNAYRQAMRAARPDEHTEVFPGASWEEDGAAAAEVITQRDRRPTVLVCFGGQSAVGAFSRPGVRVPDEISVVGFDDSYLASLSYNDLISVHQNVDATIEAAWRSVHSRIESPADVRAVVAIPTWLVERGSTGPVLC